MERNIICDCGCEYPVEIEHCKGDNITPSKTEAHECPECGAECDVENLEEVALDLASDLEAEGKGWDI